MSIGDGIAAAGLFISFALVIAAILRWIAERLRACPSKLRAAALKKMIVETWRRIKELDLVDPDTGMIIRYTMRTDSGKEKYIYFNDMINEMWEGEKPEWLKK